ncbi:MAG: AAA family ATPase [Candidatus Omnitrophica bacterium]|nr:AAA family ATPase [Candidatus Omnitrophota bacterium]
MYESFFSLNQKPFSITSNPSFLFLSQKHKEALACLTYGIQERAGFIEITGEVGTGKTTLCRALLHQLDEKTKSAYIFNSYLSESQLLQTIVDDLGIPAQKKTKGALFSELNRFLIEQLTLDNNVVLIIDEAQNLSHRLLDQIRMLSNLETDNYKLLQIILVGQPELSEKLKSPSLRQLRQRIAVRYHIGPLTLEELPLYIDHRLRQAGSNGSGPVFSEDAFQEIYEYSQGLPRLINVVCDKALLAAFVLDQKHVDGKIVKRAVAEIERTPQGDTP